MKSSDPMTILGFSSRLMGVIALFAVSLAYALVAIGSLLGVGASNALIRLLVGVVSIAVSFLAYRRARALGSRRIVSEPS
jgi:hypothetical protein